MLVLFLRFVHVLLALAQGAAASQPAQQSPGQGRGGGRGPASPSQMSFFVTSVGMGKGGDLGGLAGADAHCLKLAKAVGAGSKTWRAYLSTQARPGQPAVNARDRIGTGPWYNNGFAQLGQQQNAVISQNLGELHGDTITQAQRGSNLFKQSARTEYGQVIRGVGDLHRSARHLTGSQTDGVLSRTTPTTCNNWTSSSRFRAGRHSDRIGNMNASWNSSHATSGCSQAALESTGGAGLFYCFAVN
jgi:hypothetical protein